MATREVRAADPDHVDVRDRRPVALDVPCCCRLLVHPQQPAQPAYEHQHRAGLPQRSRGPTRDQHEQHQYQPQRDQGSVAAGRGRQGRDLRRRRVGCDFGQVQIRCHPAIDAGQGDRGPGAGNHDHLVRQRSHVGRGHPAGVVRRRLLRVHRPCRRQRDVTQRRPQPDVRWCDHDTRRCAGGHGRREYE